MGGPGPAAWPASRPRSLDGRKAPPCLGRRGLAQSSQTNSTTQCTARSKNQGQRWWTSSLIRNRSHQSAEVSGCSRSYGVTMEPRCSSVQALSAMHADCPAGQHASDSRQCIIFSPCQGQRRACLESASVTGFTDAASATAGQVGVPGVGSACIPSSQHRELVGSPLRVVLM
jgi:hypothetical protein